MDVRQGATDPRYWLSLLLPVSGRYMHCSR
jgi:hypothetical protein